MREIIMRIDGYFLVIAGLLLMLMGLASYFASAGPLRDTFKERQRPGILNWVEAFGLAAVIGIIFIYVSREAYPQFWNFVAAGAHLFMAAANVTFWRATFVALSLVIPGIATTVAHLLFVVLQLYAALLASSSGMP